MSSFDVEVTAAGAQLRAPMNMVHRGRVIPGDLTLYVTDAGAALRWFHELMDMTNRFPHLVGGGSWTARSGGERYGVLALEACSLGDSWVISAYLDGPGAQEALFLTPAAAAAAYERLFWAVGAAEVST